jgi:hypothetical protein
MLSKVAQIPPARGTRTSARSTSAKTRSIVEMRLQTQLFSWFIGLVALSRVWPALAAPGIVITNLPAYGSFDRLAGLVLNADPATTRVAVFIYVPGYGWVTKPTCAQPLTAIASDGSWTTDITTGGTDNLATRVAAFLVGTNYNQPCVQGLSFLPTNVFAQALASAVTTRSYPGPRWLSFSGYGWWVKSSAGLVGPGPNYFSDSTDNVWVDAQGQLHLRITYRSNQWQCAEVVSARTFGYGQYRFEINSQVDFLDPNVVLGAFTWSEDPAYAHREMDIECSRWGHSSDFNNAQYVVQPPYLGRFLRYSVPVVPTNSTHLFTWVSNAISFQSQTGMYSPELAAPNIITNWTLTATVPQTGDENVRVNLWLINGNPPGNHQEVEIILKSFQFVPLDSPRPVTLTNLKRDSNGQTHFGFVAQPDRRYQVQASADLVVWQDLASVLATNPVVEFSDSSSEGANRRAFRTITLP